MIIRGPHLLNNFYILDKRISEDTRLSWGARGLLVFLLGKPDNWRVSLAYLINQTLDAAKPLGRDGVYSLLHELINIGYVQRVRAVRADGTFGTTDYLVAESTHTANPEVDTKPKPQQENPKVDEKNVNLDNSGLTDVLEVISPLPALPITVNPPLTSTDIKQELKLKAVRTKAKKSKDRLKTETIFVLPDWIDKNKWSLWMKTRKGKKMIPEQMQAQIDKLKKWKDLNMDYSAALSDAADAGWMGLFEPIQKNEKYVQPESTDKRKYLN
jgi:hypothetical protein